MNPNDTLSGLYGTAKVILPDGSEVPALARKVPRGDGTFGWAIIDDRVLDLEARFANTDFKPADHLTPNTEVLDKKVTISTDDTTRRHVSADLIQFLGDPDRIIANKKLDDDRLDHMKKHPASLTMARRLCQLAGPKWQQVLLYLPAYYPESNRK